MKPLAISGGKCETERAGAVLPTPSPALEHSEPEKEVRAMSHYGDYRDSARESNAEQSDNFKPIGPLAAALVLAAAKRLEERK